MENEEFKEIIDTKYPLLTLFKEKAPGTFKHCQQVYNMCDAIIDKLKCDDPDSLLIAAMYHDIGKMNNPEYFSENQSEKNIHDDLDPLISYNVITRHVGDSVLYLLQIPNLPRKVLDIVSQHHGDTVLRHFYTKSRSKTDTAFRYKCVKPQSLESSVLMICDCVEATSRSYSLNGKLNGSDDRKNVVDMCVNRLMNDDQLDNMRVGDLKIVKSVLYKEIDNIYHKREMYDDEDENES